MLTGRLPRSGSARGETPAERGGVSGAGTMGCMEARMTPDAAGDTPWEVALRYAAGELSREQMIEVLTAWPWTHDRFLERRQCVAGAVRAGQLAGRGPGCGRGIHQP